jgi:hypothetical protein
LPLEAGADLISRRSLSIHSASCGMLLANSRVSGVIEF